MVVLFEADCKVITHNKVCSKLIYVLKNEILAV